MKKTLSSDGTMALVHKPNDGTKYPWTLRHGYKRIHMKNKEALLCAEYILKINGKINRGSQKKGRK